MLMLAATLSSCVDIDMIKNARFGRPKKAAQKPSSLTFDMPKEVHVYDDYLKAAPLVKILLLKNVNEFKLSISSPFKVYAPDTSAGYVASDKSSASNPESAQTGLNNNIDGKLVWESRGMLMSNVFSTDANIHLGSKRLKKEKLIIEPEIDGSIIINEIAYRGTIEIIPRQKGKLQVIEETDIDDYLSGVLGNEMPISWTKNTLFAQAVVARSYVMYKRKKRDLETYHISGSDLAYKGRLKEDDRAIEIINKSKGIIMVHDWKIFPAYFHSTCGGHTEDVKLVFKEKSIPPLSGVLCGYCDASRFYRWRATFDRNEFARKLRGANVGFGRYSSIFPLGAGPGGHASMIEIRSPKGAKKIDANTFRLTIGPNKLYSTAFTIEDDKNNIIISGKGWGHGVGMCQFGAQKLGTSGSKWHEILKHYYPEIDLVKVY